jgi:hypothetical protein
VTKSVASETDVPAGLDVVPMEPGTIVGSRDQQGTDGTTRTDRPGELLGTPIPDENLSKNQSKEDAKHDYVRAEVDRANREELPRLGGTVDDGWEPGNSKGAKVTEAAPVARAQAVPLTTETVKAPAAAKADSGIKVSPKIDRG